MLVDRWQDAWSALLDVPAMLTDPSQRIYWPFIASSLALGAIACLVRRRGRDKGSLVSALFPRRVYGHRSARVDAQLIVINALLRALILAPLIVSALAVATLVVRSLHEAFGPAGATGLARWQIAVLYTLTLFVAWDLSRYLLHRLMHAVPLLWQFHQVHHSAEVLTPLTVYRTHPVESLLYSLRGGIVTGLVTGVFFYLFRDRAVQFDLLGVNAIGLVFNAAGANLRHSHVWLRYGPLETWLISPAQHQLHHSRDPAHADKNFGSFLAIWDRLGGSLVRAGAEPPPTLGLEEGELNHRPTGALSCVVGPIGAVARRLVSAANRSRAAARCWHRSRSAARPASSLEAVHEKN